MSLKQNVKDYLENEPRARERRNKDRAIVNLLIKRYHSLEIALNQCILTKDDLVAIVQDYNSLDRFWRLILMMNKHLRGYDYDTKDKTEGNKLEELGYRRPEHLGPAEAVEENRQLELL